MILQLREVSPDECDRELLKKFSECREKVLKVAISAFLPNIVAVTVEGGFIELIDVLSGGFRLFLTHLGNIPLEMSLRCMTFTPCLEAVLSLSHAIGRERSVCCVLYSLASSNQVLLGEVDTGAVSVLHECESRPSALNADGDYIICGEASGGLTVWIVRSTDANVALVFDKTRSLVAFTELLWTSSTVLEDSVVALARQRHQLFGCSADMRCVMVDIDTGVLLGRLVQEPSPMVQILPLMLNMSTVRASGANPGWLSETDSRGTMVVAYRDRIAVYRDSSLSDVTWHSEQKGSSLPRAGEGAAVYAYEAECVGNVGFTCITSSRGLVAAGSMCGVVILYYCDATATPSILKEVARFDVGFSVSAIQLLYTEGGRGEAEESSDRSANCVEEEPRCTAAAHHLIVVTASGDVWRWAVEDLLPAKTQSTAEVTEAPAAEATTVKEEVSPAPQEAAASHPLTPIASSVPTPHSVSTVSPRGTPPKETEKSFEDAPVGPSAYAVERPNVKVAFSLPPNQEADHEVRKVSEALEEGEEEDGPEVVMVVEEPEVKALERLLGPTPVFPGLREGKRMDPRVIEAVQSNAAAASEGPEMVEEAFPLDLDRPRLHGSNLEQEYAQKLMYYRNTIVAETVEEFKSEHPLQAEALQYQFPVKQANYRLKDKAFEEVKEIAARETLQILQSQSVPLIAERDASSAADIEGSASGHARPPMKKQDIFREVTQDNFRRQKDPIYENERKRKGPNIHEHFCTDLLSCFEDQDSTLVLFKQYDVLPSMVAPLSLPLPIPNNFPSY